MKIIHCADLHLDSKIDIKDKAKSTLRKEEVLHSFERLCDYAKQNFVSAIIIAGDLFDSEKGSVAVVERVLEIISKAPSITFLYLPGNHEKDRLISSAVALPENLKLFGEDWTCFSKGKVNFIGRTETAKNMFSTLKLNENEINILVLHGELKDLSDAGGAIGKREISDMGIDYVALGHYHTYSHTKIDIRCSAVYSGTPEGRGFDEAGEKGFVLIEAGQKGINHTFIRSQKRTLRIVELDATRIHGVLGLRDAIRGKTADIPSCDLVRVVIKGTVNPGVKHDVDAITDCFADDFYCFEVKDESHLEISADDYKNDKSLKGEFIRLVLSRDELSEEEKESIIDCGLKALMGEE